MRKYRVALLPSAWLDLDAIAEYHLRKVGAASAKKITDRILDELAMLGDYPHMAQQHPDPVLAKNGYRKLVITRTYVAVYKVIDDAVYIYRIVNGAIDFPSLLK